MKPTADVIRCELIGTDAKVAKSRHADYVGIQGRVIDETRNTLTILHEGKKRTIIKDAALFHFKFSDGALIEIDGNLLKGRPEERLKKQVRRFW